MSQSDYLKHKKTAHILKENKLPPILNSADYTAYTRFQLTNTIINDEETNYGEIVPEGKKKIFGMEINVSNCPSFILCSSTDTRPNRVLLKNVYSEPKELKKSTAYAPDRFANCNCSKLYSKDRDRDIQCCTKSKLRMQSLRPLTKPI
jgi:hypothetical protein